MFKLTGEFIITSSLFKKKRNPWSIVATIQVKIKRLQVLLCITNNSIKHQSFVYIQLNDQRVLFQTIQFPISHLFALSLNVKQFYLDICR